MISIIIPAYNEEKRIGRTLLDYSTYFQKLKNSNIIDDFEILVVLNGCKDNTLGIVKHFQEKFQEIRYLDYEESGKGFAIIKGFKDALTKAELIGFVDADMATPPSAFYDLIKKIWNYDGVIASRGLKKSVVKTSFIRKLTNKGFNFVVRAILFLPYHDTQCGAKLFKNRTLRNIVNELGITRWTFDVDLLYRLKKKGFKVKELPTVWEDKKGSKVDLIKVPLLMFLAILRLRILNSPLKDFIRFYDKLPEWVKIQHRLI